MIAEELVGRVLFAVDSKNKRGLYARVSDMQTDAQPKQSIGEFIHHEGEQVWWAQRWLPQWLAEVLIIEEANDGMWRLIKAEWDPSSSPPWNEKSSKTFRV